MKFKSSQIEARVAMGTLVTMILSVGCSLALPSSNNSKLLLRVPEEELRFGSEFKDFTSSDGSLRLSQISKFSVFGISGKTNERLLLDLTSDVIIIGNGQAGWGLNCTEDEGCEEKGNFSQIEYRKSKIQCKEGKVISRFSPKQKIVKEEAEKYEKLPVKFCQYNDREWVFGRTGVFGLSPASQIWPYLQNSYNFTDSNSSSIAISFSYETSRVESKSRFHFLKSRIDSLGVSKLRNGVIRINNSKEKTKEEVILARGEAGSSKYWSYNGFRYSFNNILSNSTELCLDNSLNSIFAIKNSKEIRDWIVKKLCPGTTKEQRGCLLSEIDEDKLSDEGFKMVFSDDGSKEISFRLQDLVYFEDLGDQDSLMKFNFQDLSNTPSKCNSDFILGKIGMSRVGFKVKVSKAGVFFELIKLKLKKQGSILAHVLRLLVLVFIAILAFGMFSICIIRRPKLGKDSEDIYIEENSISVPECESF